MINYVNLQEKKTFQLRGVVLQPPADGRQPARRPRLQALPSVEGLLNGGLFAAMHDAALAITTRHHWLDEEVSHHSSVL
jgi:hypothetical protein